VADWHVRDSGELVINRNPQFFTTFIVKAASISRSCMMLHYQRRTDIYSINSLAICEGSTPSSLVLIFFLTVYRQSFICITFPLKNYLEFRHVVHY
jgi:hypothetical protein